MPGSFFSIRESPRKVLVLKGLELAGGGGVLGFQKQLHPVHVSCPDLNSKVAPPLLSSVEVFLTPECSHTHLLSLPMTTSPRYPVLQSHKALLSLPTVGLLPAHCKP